MKIKMKTDAQDPQDEDQEQEEEEEDQEDQDASSQLRRSTRERAPVERLVPSMKGKTYLQAAKEGINKDTKVTFDDSKDRLRKLEHCHNLIAQVSPNPDEDVEHGYDFAVLIARTMNEFNERATVHGASFAQQYILKKGLQKFGEQGAAASSKEMDQLHRRNCFTPISAEEMTPNERKKAMEALMFLSEKRDGAIKGRCVCNGKETRKWLTREDSASPAAAHESIVLTAVDQCQRRTRRDVC